MSATLSYSFLPVENVYSISQTAGVTAIVVAGGLSASAVLLWLITVRGQRKAYGQTHIFAYFVSLMVANALQSAGTVMSVKWVALGGVTSGPYCSAQGGIKQAGNVSTALWSFMIALHLFNLLFLRWESTLTGMIATLIGGWSVVGVVIFVGPEVIQTAERGPYFGISGAWCWITDNYPKEQFFLEYFFEFMSAGLGFLLYATVLLRVRGNLVMMDGKWRLRWVPRSEGWKLQLGRDIIDTCMLKVAALMVWYPVAYSLILIPISLSRLISFAGHKVPFWAIVLSDIVYNLTGFVNVFLLLATSRLVPDVNVLPVFTTPRKNFASSSTEAMGYTPFILPPKDDAGNESKDSNRPRSESSSSHRSEVIAVPQPVHAPKPRGSRSSLSTVQSQDLRDFVTEFNHPGIQGRDSQYTL